jgi:hypothetical protein
MTILRNPIGEWRRGIRLTAQDELTSAYRVFRRKLALKEAIVWVGCLLRGRLPPTSIDRSINRLSQGQYEGISYNNKWNLRVVQLSSRLPCHWCSSSNSPQSSNAEAFPGFSARGARTNTDTNSCFQSPPLVLAPDKKSLGEG